LFQSKLTVVMAEHRRIAPRTPPSRSIGVGSMKNESANMMNIFFLSWRLEDRMSSLRYEKQKP
jgi:hypothetical protein